MTIAVASDDDDFWKRVNELFHLALEVDAGNRDDFVVQQSGGDEKLLARVRKLLDAHSRGEQFLEQPTGFVSPSPQGSYLNVGDHVAQYRVLRILGEGGMGVVYLAHDEHLGREVTLKAVSPEYAHDPDRRERLRREARAAAQLKHPGIAIVHEYREHDGNFFIVGEYVDGETLREEFNRGPANTDRVLQTAIAIASALSAAHERGIVHRDLKPENIMRTTDGQIKILDFGLARLRDGSSSESTVTAVGSVLGTVAYMAPEQIRGLRDQVDSRADVFAVGIVLYEMATATHPLLGRDAASTIARILEVEVPSLGLSSSPDAQDALSAPKRSALDMIIATCLRKRPDARFANARDLLIALERARGTQPMVLPTMPTPADASQRWWKVHQVATCVAYAGLMFPMWQVREQLAGRIGQMLFLTTFVAVVASAVLRLHLWFTAASIPDEWKRQYQQATFWRRLADAAVVIGFVTGGLMTANTGLAVVLVCAGVISALSFAVIEPATTRAAFGEDH